jgi:hypothetical protein
MQYHCTLVTSKPKRYAPVIANRFGAGLTSAGGVLWAVSVTAVQPEQMMASIDTVAGEQGTD